MSSLDHDRLLHEGPEPRTRAGSALVPAGGTRSRRTSAPAAETVSTSAPAPRRGRTPRTGAPTKTTAAATKATAAKSTAAKAAAEPAPARRPRPTPRPVAPARVSAPEPAVEELAEAAAATPDVVVESRTPASGPARSWRVRSLPRRRRSLVLVAALVAALGTVSVEVAQAGPAEQPSHSMSVAAELGLSSQQRVAPDATDADRLGELTASRATRESEQAAAVQAQQQADAAAVEAARPQAVLPVNGARLTTCFCMRWGTMHWGIDLAAPMDTPEYAAMDGVVLQAGPASGFGLAVYIQHANGDVTVYGHMDQILVTAGQVVKAGDTIALLGNRGQSTGPHLHFEVHVGGITGEKVDPIPWLQARGVQVG